MLSDNLFYRLEGGGDIGDTVVRTVPLRYIDPSCYNSMRFTAKAVEDIFIYLLRDMDSKYHGYRFSFARKSDTQNYIKT